MNAPVNNQGQQLLNTAAAAAAAATNPEPDAEDELVENTSFDIPPLLEVESNPAYSGGNKFTLNLYATGCQVCSHLVAPDEDHELVEFSKCHVTNGNTYCPAQYFKIEFIGRKVRWQRKVDAIKNLPVGSTQRSNAAIALVNQAARIEDDDLRNSILQQLGV